MSFECTKKVRRRWCAMFAPESQKKQQQHNKKTTETNKTLLKCTKNIEDDLALLKNRNAPSFFCTFHHKNRLHIFVVPCCCCWSSNSNNFRKGGVSIKILIKSHKKGKTFFALLMKSEGKILPQ